MRVLSAIVVFAVLTQACSKSEQVPPNNQTRVESSEAERATEPTTAQPAQTAQEPANTLKLSSRAFGDQGSLAKRFSCQGQDVSPPLTWSGAPAGTKSFALVVDDPDAPDPAAPKTVWVHWVLYNLPSDATGLPEGVKSLPDGTREGKNDWKGTGYRGPCPPIGRHRYFYKLYALDAVLPELGDPTKAELEKAMQGHVLARAELIGLYQKE